MNTTETNAAFNVRFNSAVTRCVSVAAVFWGIVIAPPAQAVPVWTAAGTTFDGYTEAFADDPNDANPPLNVVDISTSAVPGLFGKDEGGSAKAGVGILVFTCPLKADGLTQFWVEGIGTPRVKIQWYISSKAYHSCQERTAYNAWAIADMMVNVGLGIGGEPPGTPVTVDYTWWQFSFNNLRHEAGGEDPAAAFDGQLAVDGGFVYDGDYDLDNIRGILRDGGFASFGKAAGDVVDVYVQGFTDAEINEPGRGAYAQADIAQTVFMGEIVLSLNGPPPPPGGGGGGGGGGFFIDPELDFSLDIGSDTELSDPFFDGDEVFDPGDTYLWAGPPLTPGGEDGIKDDEYAFGIDPAPDAPVPAMVAPVCSAMLPSDVVTDFFDLDGHDAMDISLTGTIDPLAPLLDPIDMLFFFSACVTPADHLAISYDDDLGGHYVGDTFFCDSPVTSSSPGGVTYGISSAEDEVMGVFLLTATSPAVVAAVYPVVDEESLHISLGPNPDLIEEEDDDVDSLDMVEDMATCDVWYFSPDHEAPHFDPMTGIMLDPGSIYEVAPGGGFFELVIDEAIHLGLPEETDIDAFEFVHVMDPFTGIDALTLLYSVDDDDYLTPGDESGGLDPKMIYASTLTGFSYEFIDFPLDDDIDALTAWWSPITAPPTPCATMAARSCADHGPWGRLCLDMTGGGAIEPRSGGIMDVEVDLDDASGFLGGVTVDCVTSGDMSGLVSGAVALGSTVNVTFSAALPDGDACTITLDCGASICVQGLRGDIDRNGVVSTGDASVIKPKFGAPVPFVGPEYDFDENGVVSTGDASTVKPLFGNSAPGCP